MTKKFFLQITFQMIVFACFSQTQWQIFGGQNIATQLPSQTIHVSTTGIAYCLGNSTISGHNYSAVLSSSGNPLGFWNILSHTLKDTSVHTVATDSLGNVYAAGDITDSLGNFTVAKLVGKNWQPIYSPIVAKSGSISKIVVDKNNNIYAIGFFKNASGHYYVAKYNGASWSELGGSDSLRANGVITAICSDNNNNIYVGGYFTKSSGKNFIAKYDANNNSWGELGDISAINNSNTFSICADHLGNIYATIRNKSTLNYEIAKFNGTSWISLPFPSDFVNGTINSLCVDSKNRVLAAGNFKKQFFFGMSAEPFVAELNGNVWSPKAGSMITLNNSTIPNPVHEIYEITTDANDDVFAATDNRFGNGSNILKWTAPIAPPPLVITTNTTSVCKYQSVTIKVIKQNLANTSFYYTYYKNGLAIDYGYDLDSVTTSIQNNGDSVWCTVSLNSQFYNPNNEKSNVLRFAILATPTLSHSIIGNSLSCKIGQKDQLSIQETGGSWSVSDSSIATITNSGQLQSLTSGGVNVYYKKMDPVSGCTSAANFSYIILPVGPLPAITGNNSLCVKETAQYSNTYSDPYIANTIWETGGKATIDGTGTAVATGSGNTYIKYTVTNFFGCSAVIIKNIVVNPLPPVPTIQYAPGTPNPQTGIGGAFCVGKVFTLVGSPATSGAGTGIWSSSNTNVMTVGPNSGLVKITAAGNAILTYTYTTAAGCVNSRSVSGTAVTTCFGRGVNTGSNEQVVSSNEFTMYPNPAKTFVSLKLKTVVGIGSIVVTDLYGKQVKMQPLSMGNNTLDIASLSKGFYLVSIITEQGKTMKKLVVE